MSRSVSMSIAEDKLYLYGLASTYPDDNGYTGVDLKDFTVLAEIAGRDLDITGVIKLQHEKLYSRLFEQLKTSAIEAIGRDSSEHHKRIVG